MGLELMTWPHMELFFGDDADRFRTGHLEDALTFVPYGAAVDAFQHLIYDRPEATADERAEMWKSVERDFLPWRRYADMPYAESGRIWQRQRHIYMSPFYYIDYAQMPWRDTGRCATSAAACPSPDFSKRSA